MQGTELKSEEEVSWLRGDTHIDFSKICVKITLLGGRVKYCDANFDIHYYRFLFDK